MNPQIFEEIQDHLQSLTSEVNTIIKRNNRLMLKCENFNEALPYLENHYDLICINEMNGRYMERAIFTPSERAISQ